MNILKVDDNYSAAMIDIESLATTADAAILSIGACVFDLNGIVESSKFYQEINLNSCLALGLKVDGETLAWWMKQANNSILISQDNANDLHGAMNEFYAWQSRNNLHKDCHVWANSPSFDCQILRTASERTGTSIRWQFRNERDYRTIMKFANLQFEPNKNKHSALDDAIYQAECLVQLLRLARREDMLPNLPQLICPNCNGV